MNNKTEFAGKIIIGFPVIGIVWTYLIFWLTDAHSPDFWIAYGVGGIGLALGIFCLLSTTFYHLISKLWEKLVSFLDLVVTWITLPLFYYFIFSPFAVVIRIFGKATLNKKNKKATFWVDVSPTTSLKQYFRQF